MVPPLRAPCATAGRALSALAALALLTARSATAEPLAALASERGAAQQLRPLAGHPRCPCIDPWGPQGGGVPAALTFVDSQTGRGCLKSGQNCYPLDYGSGACRAWDINLAPNCADQAGRPLTNAPDSCGDLWCYVDKVPCGLQSAVDTRFEGYSLAKSYAACGSVDLFSTEVLVSTLRGRVLKAGVPHSSPRSLHTDTKPIKGYSADWLYHLARKSGFSLQIENISRESLYLHPKSSYTACVRDVAIGLKDICFGEFWETPERLAMTGFSPITGTSLKYLVVHGEGGAGDMVGKIFRPFSLDLWVAFVVLFGLVGFLMWLFGEVGDLPALQGILVGIRKASLHFMGHGGGYDRSYTRSGHFVVTGFGFICMLGLASYTASLSSFLLMSSMNTNIKDLDDAVSKGVKICILQASKGMLISFNPKVKQKEKELLVLVPDWESAVDSMDANKCGAMLMDTEMFTLMRAGQAPFDKKGSDGHCKKHLLTGEVVVAAPMAIPLRRELDHAMGWVFARSMFDGELHAIQEDYPIPEPICPQDQGLREGAVPLGFLDMMGGFLVGVVFLAMAMGIHLTGRNKKEKPGGAE